MNKRWALIAAGVALATTTTVVQTTTGVSPSAVASAGGPASLAFVAGSDPVPGPDAIVVAHLEAAGHAVSIIDDDDLAGTDVEVVDAVIISSSVDPNTVGTQLADTAAPVISWEGHNFVDLGLATRGGETQKQRRRAIFTGAHPIAGGLSGAHAVTSGLHRLSYGTVGSGADVIATEQVSDRPVIFAYDEGATLANGQPAPAPRVGFHFDYAAPTTATEVSWAAFDRAVMFAVGDGSTTTTSTTSTSTTSSTSTTTTSTTSTTTTTMPGGPAGNQVGFIGGKVRPDGLPVEQSDRIIFDHFGELGLEFTFVDDDNFLDPGWDPMTELAGFDLLMLSSGVEVHKVDDGLRHIPIPLVTWEGFLHDENGMASKGGEVTPRQIIRVVDGTPFSGAFDGVVGIHTQPERLSYGIVGGDVIVGATVAGKSRFATIFGYTAGSQLADGTPAPAARVGFFVDWQSIRTATSATWELFESAVEFARR